MSLLFNMLYSFVTAFPPRSKCLLISWLQSPSAVILEPPKIKSATASTFPPSICHEVMRQDTMILVFWVLIFKPTFSLYSFTLSKRLSDAAAAKLLQSSLTLCNAIDGSPPSSTVLGILQAGTLEWVAISFSNAWKWTVKVKSLIKCLTCHDLLGGSSIHGIFQAGVLEWGAIAFSGISVLPNNNGLPSLVHDQTTDGSPALTFPSP